jgi:predicted dehydrogenase
VLLTVDYVMRQNPLWAAAAALRESGLLGALLHMDLANHAAGLNLAPDHWFWDKAQSGGIWIEHGVHFFDAFAWVAGEPGEITAAQAFSRADGREDRVAALARYGRAAAHFYHGFTHSSADEQTVVQLTFEHGYVTLDEWVPTQLRLLTTVSPHALQPLLAGAVSSEDAPGGQTLLTATLTEGKSAVYRRAIQDGMSQLARGANGDAQALRVTGAHGLASLRMALDAEWMGASRPHNTG